MNFIKKMCVLRQVKQGFSSDGKTLSGLIKIEQYGKNISVEASVINFAPLSSGEYYCLIADEKERTELLPLRGKSLFNIVSELDLSNGFCGVICFVKNGITPIAYGVNGDKIYDWRALAKNVLPLSNQSDEAVFAAEPPNIEKSPASTERSEANVFQNQYDDKRDDKYDSKYNSKYDDETVATENYYDREEKENERIVQEKTHTYVHAESGNQEQTTEAGTNAEENGDAENVRHPFEPDPDGYYRAIKSEIDELFAKYPTDDRLKSAFAYSEWVRVKEEGKEEYLVGVIYEDLKAKYICYALPAADRHSPPEELKDICTFVPVSLLHSDEGFFVIFQSTSTGECIRAESL
jgi:hypothetical protein